MFKILNQNHYLRKGLEKFGACTQTIKSTKICLLLLSLFCLSFLGPQSTLAMDSTLPAEKRVLFISSYSYSWGSVPHQIAGINKALQHGSIINFEFMDTKNTAYSKGYKEFYDLLSYKMHYRLPYDAVIVGDDAALNFAQLYRNDLFRETPIIFEGIDNIENALKAAEDPLITGIVEKVDYEKNVTMARKLFPKAKKLIFILDDAENGVGIANQLKKYANSPAFKDLETEYLNSADYSKSELCTKLNSLDESNIVFCISMSKGPNNRVYTEEDRYNILRNFVHIPLFRVTQSGIGDGNFLGGYVVLHDLCGEIAGDLVKKIWKADDPRLIKPVLNTPQGYYFDANIMEKYNISEDVLPPSSIIVNRRMSFWQKNYQDIYITISILVAGLLGFLLHQKNERTKAALAYNKTLEATNKALKDANKYKTDFFSRMSHDIRTPMNIIIGMTAMAQENKNPPATDDCLDKIRTSSTFLLGLVNDVLDMSKVESGNVKLNLEPYSFAEYDNYLKSIILPLCDQKGIKFVYNHDKDIIRTFMMDKLKLNQIFFNILSNAVKFTPEGGSITLTMGATPLGKGMYRIHSEIKDTGIGMSEEFQKHLFEPFSQEEQKRDSEHVGTGLGLAIVKKYVELMGGKIWLTSAIGKGTTFFLEEDFKEVPQGQELKQSSNVNATPKENIPSTAETGSAPAQDAYTALQGKHILVCEDHPLNQQLIKHLLEKKGLLVTMADDGQRGVSAFTSSTPNYYDAILMDIRMPIMNGLEATKAIRALSRPDAQTIPIIAMTANAFDEDRQESLKAGMNEHIAKPINPKLLFAALLKFIKAYRAQK